jgi:hypothetical protein
VFLFLYSPLDVDYGISVEVVFFAHDGDRDDIYLFVVDGAFAGVIEAMRNRLTP